MALEHFVTPIEAASTEEICHLFNQLQINQTTSVALLQQRLQQLTEQHRQIVLHTLLLNHSLVCGGCLSENCQKMKNIIQHRETCRSGDCDFCQRIDRLYSYHARGCSHPAMCRACSIKRTEAPCCLDCSRARW